VQYTSSVLGDLTTTANPLARIRSLSFDFWASTLPSGKQAQCCYLQNDWEGGGRGRGYCTRYARFTFMVFNKSYAKIVLNLLSTFLITLYLNTCALTHFNCSVNLNTFGLYTRTNVHFTWRTGQLTENSSLNIHRIETLTEVELVALLETTNLSCTYSVRLFAYMWCGLKLVKTKNMEWKKNSGNLLQFWGICPECGKAMVECYAVLRCNLAEDMLNDLDHDSRLLWINYLQWWDQVSRNVRRDTST
jgi:hypothetical protein